MPGNAERSRVTLVDTSVAVALAVAEHEAHGPTVNALRGRTIGLAGHAWFETFSVLTRLPSPVRRRPSEVARLLAHNFPESRFLDVKGQQGVTTRLAELGIAGGSVYDALVGAAARHHSLPLLTRDRRALDTYRALGVDFDFLP